MTRGDAEGNAVGATRAAVLLLVGGALLLAGLAVLTPGPPVYDEPWYLATVGLIHRYGLSVRFLKELPGPAGPLYSVVHAAFEPVTHLRPPGVRCVNLGFLAVTAVVLTRVLRLVGVEWRRVGALSLVAVPMVWPMAGLALTEFPAICCATIAVYLLLLGLRQPAESGAHGLLPCAAGGLALAAAVSGRQPFIVLLGGLVFLLDRSPRRLAALGLFAIPPLATLAALYAVWGGLVPPKTAYVAGGVSVSNGILGLFYAGVVALLLAPRFFVRGRRIAAGLLGAGLVLPLFGVDFGITPLRSVALRVLPAPAVAVYSGLVTAAAFCVGMLFATSTVVRMWEMRRDRRYLFVTLGMLLCVVAVAAIPHQFSSRYVGTAAPLIVVAVAPRIRPDWIFVALTTVGMLAGFLSLASYLHVVV